MKSPVLVLLSSQSKRRLRTQRKTHKPPEARALSLSASQTWLITFQDWLGYTFGPIRAWHTYRNKPCLVSSPSSWLSLKEVLNVRAGAPSSLDTRACRVTQHGQPFLAADCQLGTPLLLRLLLQPCEPLTWQICAANRSVCAPFSCFLSAIMHFSKTIPFFYHT